MSRCKARRIARAHLETYLRLPAHLAKFRRLGFTDDDFAAGGSNRLVDALVAWGNMDDVLAKLQAHFEAGAHQWRRSPPRVLRRAAPTHSGAILPPTQSCC